MVTLPENVMSKLEQVEALYGDDKLLRCSRILSELTIELDSMKGTSMDMASVLQEKLDSPFFQRVQCECEEVHAFKQALNDDQGWTLSYDGADTKVHYRREPDTSSHSILITGTIRAPLVNIAALLYEADLYPSLFWYIVSSSCLDFEHTSMMRRAVHMESFVPWPLSNRDAAIVAYTIDALDKDDDAVFVISRSIGANDNIDDVPEPVSRVVRAQIKNSGFELQPVSPGVTKARFLINIDARLNFIPMTVINWASRMLCRWSLRTLEARACDLSKVSDEYEQRLDSRPVYEHIGIRLEEYWNEKGVVYNASAVNNVGRCSNESQNSDKFNADEKPDIPPSIITSLIMGDSRNPNLSQDADEAPPVRRNLVTKFFGNQSKN